LARIGREIINHVLLARIGREIKKTMFY